MSGLGDELFTIERVALATALAHLCGDVQFSARALGPEFDAAVMAFAETLTRRGVSREHMAALLTECLEHSRLAQLDTDEYAWVLRRALHAATTAVREPD